MLVENPSSATDNSKAITQSVDSIAMLGHLNTHLSQFRREQIKPALKSEYSAICSAEVPLSSQYLFGDDLAKKLRDARESSKISNSVSHSSSRPTYKGGQRSSGHPDHYPKGPKRDFLYKGHNRSFKRKKTTECREEIMKQLLQIKNSVSVFTNFLPNLLRWPAAIFSERRCSFLNQVLGM